MVIGMRLFKVWLMPDLLFKLSKYYKIQQDSLKILHGTTENVIKQRREELKKRKDDDNKDDESFCKHSMMYD